MDPFDVTGGGVADDARLDKAIEPLVRSHPTRSGVVTLPDGRDAFAARVLLADAAERTLDAQYYIWHQDQSGTLLFEALHRAAERGVRVRLLLDDNNTTGLDKLLAALNGHPNIEVRLFNPFRFRRWRAFGYLTDFAQLNRRMHNKAFIADNEAAIVGGRNIGDEYFDAGEAPWFVDLDVLAIGPVISEVAHDFERYWESESSRPAECVLPAVDSLAIAGLATIASRVRHAPAAQSYMQALARRPFVDDLLAGRLEFDWVDTHLVSDDPAKALGRAAGEALLWPRLRRILGRPEHELELVSPYFVPTGAGVDYFTDTAKRGVAISVMTNALEATDVAAVHAGYAKWRKSLLKAGIKLFELKRLSSPPAVRDRGLTGHSASSLHAKAFSVDRSRIFIGSLNFDPRSARLNTEMGFVIDSPQLADALADIFASDLFERMYEVRLSDAGELQWVEQQNGSRIIHNKEPDAGLRRRAIVFVLSFLPIEWLL